MPTSCGKYWIAMEIAKERAVRCGEKIKITRITDNLWLVSDSKKWAPDDGGDSYGAKEYLQNVCTADYPVIATGLQPPDEWTNIDGWNEYGPDADQFD